MRAVSEAAERCGRSRHVVEGLGEAFLGLPEAKFPHPGRVQEQPARREAKQLAVRGRVAPAAVGAEGALAISSLPARRLTSDDLPTPDDPEGVDGAARGEVRRELLDAFAREVADNVHRTPIAVSSTSRTAASTSRHRSGLRQDDHRSRPALPTQRQ